MKFKCYKDKLYIVLNSLINTIFTFATLICIIYGIWLGGIIFLLLLGVFNYYFFSICYILHDEFLEIKVLFFSKQIKYKDIIEIKPTANTLSSFALSRQRIGIRTSKNWGKFNYIYISPEKENEFLQILVKHCKK